MRQIVCTRARHGHVAIKNMIPEQAPLSRAMICAHPLHFFLLQPKSVATIDRGAKYRISGASATRELKRARNTGTNN